jgi:hypothetical protein
VPQPGWGRHVRTRSGGFGRGRRRGAGRRFASGRRQTVPECRRYRGRGRGRRRFGRRLPRLDQHGLGRRHRSGDPAAAPVGGHRRPVRAPAEADRPALCARGASGAPRGADRRMRGSAVRRRRRRVPACGSGGGGRRHRSLRRAEGGPADSAGVLPTAEPHTGTPTSSSRGPTSRTQASMPGFWMPIPFNMPAPTGASRGAGRPDHGSPLTDLATAAP